MKILNRCLIHGLGLGLLVMLTACQQVLNKPEATAPSQPAERVTFEQSARCSKDVDRSAVGQFIFAQVIYSETVAPERTELLVSNNTLSDAQRAGLEQFIEKNKACRTLRLQAFREYELRQVLIEHYERMDALYVALLTQKLTIAQGNAQLKTNFELYGAQIKKVINRLREVDEERVG